MSIPISKRQRRWIPILVLLLLGAHLSLTALVPLQAGDAAPPWWGGGMLLWPFDVQTHALLPSGDMLDTLTPILAITSAMCFFLAAAALLRRVVPTPWLPWLIAAGAIFSIALQAIWFSGWAVLPLLVDAGLLWAVFGRRTLSSTPAIDRVIPFGR